MGQSKATRKLWDNHIRRFRAVANLYSRCVTEAYEGKGGIRAAAKASDKEVAATVRAWEIANGIKPRNWKRIGWIDEGRCYDRGFPSSAKEGV